MCGGGAISCLLFLRCRCKPLKALFKFKDDRNNLFGWDLFSSYFPRAHERSWSWWWGALSCLLFLRCRCVPSKAQFKSKMTTTLSLGRICFPYFFHKHMGGFGFCGEGASSCLLFRRCRGKPTRAQAKYKDDHNKLFGWGLFSTYFPRPQERIGFL